MEFTPTGLPLIGVPQQRNRISYIIKVITIYGILDELVQIGEIHICIHVIEITAHGQQDVICSINVILPLTVVEEIRNLLFNRRVIKDLLLFFGSINITRRSTL